MPAHAGIQKTEWIPAWPLRPARSDVPGLMIYRLPNLYLRPLLVVVVAPELDTWQSKSDPPRHYEGVGFGLANARRIAHAHGDELTSRVRPVGYIFEVTFPAPG